MAYHKVAQWTIEITSDLDSIPRWFDAFLIDRKSQNMSAGTLRFYRDKLKLVDKFLAGQQLTRMSDFTPTVIRSLLIDLEGAGHNSGGIHQVYRALRAFLNWYEREEEPANWQNPMCNVKAPRLSDTPLKPIEIRTVEKLLSVCGGNLCGLRDHAIILFLLDSGLRASELLTLNTEDVDSVQGDVQVKNGKGRKSRVVVIGRKCRKAMRLYMRARADDNEALWITDEGGRLTYWGLNMILRRRAKSAGVPKPELHDFRRAFALNCLRNGMDVFSLQRLMGHADLQVMRRYLAQTDDDLRTAHAKASPVDNAILERSF